MKTIFTVIVAGLLPLKKRLLLEKKLKALVEKESKPVEPWVHSHEMNIHDIDTIAVRSLQCFHCKDIHAVIVTNAFEQSHCPACGRTM